MGNERHGLLAYAGGALFCAFGLLAQFFVARRLKCPLRLNLLFVALVAAVYALSSESAIPSLLGSFPQTLLQDYIPAATLIFGMACVGAMFLMLVLDRIPKFDRNRRGFLHASTVTACAIPAAMMGAAVITRKDFKVNEVDIAFPSLPKDLNGLRLLQISDIHMSPFFSRSDLRRVVDASNAMRPDLAFVTGDLITTRRDPLDECLAELQRLRSGTGVWGCMGNHEAYIHCQSYVQQRAWELGIDFLRQERCHLRFGNSSLNLVGVDHQFHRPYLTGVENLVSPADFNLLLSHTPEVFEVAHQKGFQLTLSGHTHGGQINLEVAGTNFNIVDLETPYTKGLYRRGASAIYVNSGLGTIGIPARIGAPPEITVIRLCNS